MRLIKKYNILLALLFSIIFFNCATYPPSSPVTPVDNPNIPLIMPGLQVEITDFEVKKIRAVMDNEGRAHILAVSKSPRRLYYIVLDKELTPKIQLVNIKGKYANLDLAIDSKGVLHAIFDNFHFVLNQGEWEKYLKCKCNRILRCGKYIACAFISDPKEVGRQWRINWYGLAGCCPGAVIIWPWFSFADKLVVARYSGLEWKDWKDVDPDTLVDWTVIDPDTTLDIHNNFSIAADNSGTLHIIYYRDRNDLFHGISELTYAKIPPPVRLIDFSKDKLLKTISGERIRSIETYYHPFCAAVDPITGNVLVIAYNIKFQNDEYYSLIINGNDIGTFEPFLRGTCYEAKVAAAGGGRFLSLILSADRYLWYLEYFKNKWSKPIRLGKYNSPQLDKFEILSNYNSNSVAIWINDDGRIVAKLFELNK